MAVICFRAKCLRMCDWTLKEVRGYRGVACCKLGLDLLVWGGGVSCWSLPSSLQDVSQGWHELRELRRSILNFIAWMRISYTAMHALINTMS
jgi:hypothetical protein